ncbi:MAG TPA: GFA family protein [Burkholderiales bacterium]|nr:GFA family protein [Burkholderiales bacterium]
MGAPDHLHSHHRFHHGKTYHGSCFCGAVEVEVSGEPAAMGYCHCDSCRSWAKAPVNAFTLWKPEAVKVTKGAENVASFSKTPRSHRKWCKVCGGHLFTDHPLWGVVDVYAATIPDFPYHAGIHVNYQETVLPMKDGLPKMKDYPAEMGGSGLTLAE